MSRSRLSTPQWQLSTVIALSVCFGACGHKREVDDGAPGEVTDHVGQSDAGKSRPVVEDKPVVPDCPPGNPFCHAPPPEMMPVDTCGADVIDLAQTGVNVMIAVDGSASMAPHWARVQDAVQKVRSENHNSDFGLHMFYADPPEDLDALLNKSNLCGKTENLVLDVGKRSQQELLDFL